MKKRFRQLAFIFLGLILVPVFSRAATDVRPGAAVSSGIGYIISNPYGATSIEFSLSLDEDGIELVDIHASYPYARIEQTNEGFKIIWDRPLSGSIGSITVRAKDDATPGEYYYRWDFKEATNNNGDIVSIVFSNQPNIHSVYVMKTTGEPTEEDIRNNNPGDVNEDGKVDLADSLILDQCCRSGWEYGTISDGIINEWNADVNQDGILDGTDVSLILEYTCGLDVDLEGIEKNAEAYKPVSGIVSENINYRLSDSDLPGIPGTERTVFVGISDNNENAVAALIGIEYDTNAFEFVKAERSGNEGWKIPERPDGSFGTLSSYVLDEGGTIGKITLKIKETAIPGDYTIKGVVNQALNAQSENVYLNVFGSKLSVEVPITEVEGYTGNEVTVQFGVNENPNGASYAVFDINYDKSALELIDVNPNYGWVSSNYNAYNTISYSVAETPSIIPCVFGTLTFSIKENAVARAYDVDFIVREAKDNRNEDVSISAFGGTITILETEAPTTEAPTTEAPTTEAPTTEVPTTEAPTTEATTTMAPTTEALTTEAPTTEAPTTQKPHEEQTSSGETYLNLDGRLKIMIPYGHELYEVEDGLYTYLAPPKEGNLNYGIVTIKKVYGSMIPAAVSKTLPELGYGNCEILWFSESFFCGYGKKINSSGDYEWDMSFGDTKENNYWSVLGTSNNKVVAQSQLDVILNTLALNFAKPSRVSGDADDDGKVDMLDALLILQSVSGMEVPINTDNANVNGDSVIDEKDARLILQNISGWDVELQ